MATRDRVGNSVSEFLQDMSEYELTCPICFEEFKEPKSLPNCAHSVCLQCLEKMSERSSHILKCPVCRVESPLPSNGVKAWPTNSRIVRLMDRFPGRQDKLAIKNAIESCRKACDITAKRDEERNSMSHTVKKEVEEKAQKLVEFIRDQERSLLDMIDEVLMSECAGNTELREQAVSLSSKADNIIERGDVYEIVDAKETLVTHLEKITKELEPSANDNFADLLRRKLQGERSLTAHASSAKTASNRNINCFDPKYNRIITKTKDLDSFFPFDLAVSSAGYLVVLDSRFQNVIIFDEGGVFRSQFQVSFQDLWGLTVSKNDEIIILSNDSTDGCGICGYLIYFDINGNFIQKKTVKEFKNTFLTGISLDDNNDFIITSGVFLDDHNRYTQGGMLVLNQNLQVKFSIFDSQNRLNMRKAVHYHGKYYCTELTEPGKKSCIKVFDKEGKVVQEFGQIELRDPHGLVVDYQTSRILICDRQLNAILVYNLEGNYLTRFNTKDDPLQITMAAKNKDITVACYLGLCIQVISYKWFLEVSDQSIQALKWLG